MVSRFKNRIALVTGAAMGIGREIALRLANEGADLVLFDLSEKVHDVVDEARKLGVEALGVTGDVSRRVDVERLVSEAVRVFGKIDILVNNAGIYPFKPFLEMSEDDWDRVINVNLKGTFLVTRQVAPLMVKQMYGRIINISSISGLVGFPGLSHYCASKAGVIGLTRALALELAPYNITVNTIAPGPIETGTRASTPQIPEQIVKQEQIVRAIPIGRIGKPADIALTVVFLASEEAGFITGSVIVVDGGYTAQ